MDDYLTKPIEEHILQQVLVHWSPHTRSKQVAKVTPPDGAAVISNALPSSPPAEEAIIDWPVALRQSANKEDLAKEMLGMLVDYLREVETVVNTALEDEEYPLAICCIISISCMAVVRTAAYRACEKSAPVWSKRCAMGRASMS